YEAPRAAADGGTRLGGAESKRRRRPRLPAPPSRVTLLGGGGEHQAHRLECPFERIEHQAHALQGEDAEQRGVVALTEDDRARHVDGLVDEAAVREPPADDRSVGERELEPALGLETERAPDAPG